MVCEHACLGWGFRFDRAGEAGIMGAEKDGWNRYDERGYAPVAQWIEHLPSKQQAVSSSLAWGAELPVVGCATLTTRASGAACN